MAVLTLAETSSAEAEEVRMFMPGNEALAEAAIRAGCRFYAGYPITPATEILEYMAKRMPTVGGVCMFPGTEIEGITMAQGAAGAGARSMIASASTAYSLMQETLAECANGGWPLVIVNMCRGALQGDYYQTAKGGGHGDYQILVLAPSTNQEMVELTQEAFDIAERYRHPVIIFGDSLLAKTTETVVFRKRPEVELPEKTWAANGESGRSRNSVTFIGKSGLSTDTRGAALAGQQRFLAMAEREARWETGYADDADVMVVAFGTAGRYAKQAIEQLRKEGVKIGFFRPITINPFPTDEVAKAAESRKLVICYELNSGQMVQDVRAAVFGAAPVYAIADNVKHGTYGGAPQIADLADQFRHALRAHKLLT